MGGLTITKRRPINGTGSQTGRSKGGDDASNAPMGHFDTPLDGANAALEVDALSARTVHVEGSGVGQGAGKSVRVVAGGLHEPRAGTAKTSDEVGRRGRHVAAGQPQGRGSADAVTIDNIDRSEAQEHARGGQRHDEKNREQPIVAEHGTRVATSRPASQQGAASAATRDNPKRGQNGLLEPGAGRAGAIRETASSAPRGPDGAAQRSSRRTGRPHGAHLLTTR